MNKLLEIQSRLKAPKGQFNSFGKYNYRNCEDILEAVKPLLKELGATLVISDEIVEMGGRFYVKATATLTDGDMITKATAYAREAADKKGMDEAQITGSASSYARKYALNGLFLIDDTKDADSTNTHGKEEQKEVDPAFVAKREELKKKMADSMNAVLSVSPKAQKPTEKAVEAPQKDSEGFAPIPAGKVLKGAITAYYEPIGRGPHNFIVAGEKCQTFDADLAKTLIGHKDKGEEVELECHISQSQGKNGKVYENVVIDRIAVQADW